MLQVSKSNTLAVVSLVLLYGCGGADPEIAGMKAKLETLTSERDSLLQANDALTKERGQLSEALDSVKVELAAATAGVASLTEQLNQASAKGAESHSQPESLFISRGWQVHTAPDGSVFLFPPAGATGH